MRSKNFSSLGAAGLGAAQKSTSKMGWTLREGLPAAHLLSTSTRLTIGSYT